ncbi:DAK2 domain-containing protein [Alteromonas gracilis]
MEESDAATFDLGTFLRFADLAVDGLAAAREEIDALNVYPVPDGDTGTNMFLTVEQARDAARVAAAQGEGSLRQTLSAFGRGALLGARGNSGVILSQLVGALLRRLATAGPGDRAAAVFADGMRVAVEAAYAAVGTPVEGTILTVAREAAAAAEAAAAEGSVRLAAVVSAATEAAIEALARTPEQLEVLRAAGVVDAGGRGLCVVLDAADQALTGRRPRLVSTARPAGLPVPLPTDDLTADGPAYEVMYLLDADDEAIPALRHALAPLGDSLVVVGGEGLWHVHVHVDDVGAAVEAGIDAGRPRRIRVTHFAEQIARSRPATRDGRAVVAVAAGPGLSAIFAEAGATVLEGGPGRRPSTGEVLAAIERAGTAEVIVLPNDPDSVRVCEAAAAAAAEREVRVVVVPTRAQVQGLAAMAVHEPGRSLESDVVAMTSAARHARHGAVTVAARQAMTSAGPCEPGDALGVLEGDFVSVGDDLAEAARALIDLMLSGGGELVTIVAGVDGSGLASALEAHVEERHQGVDVVVYDGGQERYPLLMSVE